MADRYSYARSRVASGLSEWKTGIVTLLRTVNTPPDAETPWTPGVPTLTVFDLDAVVKGVTAGYVDGTTVVATDLVVIASPIARLEGVPVSYVPTMADALLIDGAQKVIKRIQSSPAGGEAVVFRIFIAS